jgi:hypothetical protein
MLANLSVVVALLVSVGILWTRNGFKDMFEEFDLNKSLPTTIALWVGLPILVIGITVLLFLIGMRPSCRLIANRLSVLSIVFSMIAGLIYIWGVVSSIVTMVTDLAR